MAWNPISKDSWLYDFSVVNPPQSSIFIHSTYRDNPFLSAEYVASLEELYQRNPAKARIYCDGEWGIDEEGLVLTNWKAEEFDPQELAGRGLSTVLEVTWALLTRLQSSVHCMTRLIGASTFTMSSTRAAASWMKYWSKCAA